MKKNVMLFRVLWAIALGLAVGSIISPETTFFGIRLYSALELGGQLFLNALSMLVVPLIVSSIINGLGQMQGGKSFGRLGIKTFTLYVVTVSLAILLGVFAVNLIGPGYHYKQSLASTLQAATPSVGKIPSAMDIVSQLTSKIIPANIFEAASHGNMLGLIFFSLLFGITLMNLEGKAKEVLVNFWSGLSKVLMKMTQLIMKAMPLGVFCLVTKVIAAQGFQTINALLFFFMTVMLGLSLFWVVLLVAMKLLGLRPSNYLRAVSPALLTAFSTSSSAATLPVTMECVEKRAGVSSHICGFVVPLGTSMNMAGSALYEFVAALFIAQAFGVDMSIGHQIILAILCLLTSMGIAGLPSGSLVAIMVILNAMGLPAEGLSLILPLDRILDMCRTTTNVFSDTSCAVMVAHFEGEKVVCDAPIQNLA